MILVKAVPVLTYQDSIKSLFAPYKHVARLRVIIFEQNVLEVHDYEHYYR